MRNIVLMSQEGGLAKELAAILPKGYKLDRARAEKASVSGGTACVFFDIDSEEVHRIKDLSKKIFVVAVTQQEKTGPVMEAATWGAYEIMQRPLRKERVERLLNELRELKSEMEHPISITKDTITPAATCVIVGRSTLVMSLCEKIARIAQVEVPVFVAGETGTGKELVA